MCLTSQRKEPFIAKKDLKVFKLLTRVGNNEYNTPYFDMPVKLNTTIKAESQRRTELQYGKTLILGGYIHSKIGLLQNMPLLNPSMVVAEAYIPKGSKYYIGQDYDVCSDKLFITDKIYDKLHIIDKTNPNKVNIDDINLTDKEREDLFAPVAEFISSDKISAGWLMDNNHRIFHPSECYKLDDIDNYPNKRIIGVVGGFDDDGNILVLSTYPIIVQYEDFDKAVSNGWYRGTLYEHCLTFGDNLDIIGMTYSNLGLPPIDYKLWTNTKINDYACLYELNNCSVNINAQAKGLSYQTIPFLKVKVANGKTEIINK